MEATENKFKLRQIGTKDIFSMSRVISKIGVKNFKRCFDNDEIKKAVASMTGGDDKAVSAVGVTVVIEIADVLFEHLPDCEKELYQFLSNLSGIKPAEIAELPPADFFEMVVAVIKKPEFKDFFKVALKSFR